jgi:hypothetical protein
MPSALQRHWKGTALEGRVHFSNIISHARNVSPVGDFIPALSDWDHNIPERAHSLLTVLVKKYNNAATSISASTSKPAKGIFAMAVKGHAETKKKTLLAGKDEVDMYFSGISPVVDSFIYLGNGR